MLSRGGGGGGLPYCLGVLFKISNDHPCHFYMGDSPLPPKKAVLCHKLFLYGDPKDECFCIDKYSLELSLVYKVCVLMKQCLPNDEK